MNKKQHPYYKHLIVSDCGRIFSTARGKERELKSWDSKGYIYVGVYVEYKRNIQRAVHRLVAETFIPNPENLREVDHIDCNKKNNHVSNLDWVSSKENKRRAWENNLYTMIGDNHCGSVLTEALVHSICQALQDGMRNKDVAQMFGVHKDQVGHIRRGTIWKIVSSQYKLTVVRKERKSVDFIIKICELIRDGYSNSQIMKNTNISISRQDLHRIRAKQIFKNISDSYF